MISSKSYKVCVFCGSKSGNDESYLKIAFKVGKELSEKKYTIIYGGGKVGLMGALADGVSSNKGNLFVSFFHEIKNINISLSTLTKINCLLVKKTIEKYYKKKIVFKKPNDLLINKKKISGILQEIISVSGNEFLIVGIGVNLIKSPKIKNYPTTNLSELINKPINKINFENELKVIFVKNLSRMYKINNKVNKK